MPNQSSIYSGAFAPQSQSEADGLQGLPGLTQFETAAQKGASLVEGYQHWGDADNAFPATWMDQIRTHGSIPYLSWEARRGGAADGTPAGDPQQPDFALKQIYVAHRYDSYIHQWAHDAGTWGHPFFLRLNPEMNANRQPFCALQNGNQMQDYVLAWKYVRAIMQQEGATNVTWVWCPTIHYPQPSYVPLADLWMLYPGPDQVDWVGIDGYNFGQNNTPGIGSSWQTFADVFTSTYDAIQAFAPGKPVIIETGSGEQGGSKAAWITDAYQTQVPQTFTHVRAAVWFSGQSAALNLDTRIDSSPDVLTAFQAALAAPHFAGNEFASLASSPIPPLSAI